MENLEQAKLIPIQDIIFKIGSVCPKCGHELEKGRTNRCKCHKCNTIYSTVDLIMESQNVNLNTAIKMILGNDVKPVDKKELEQMKANIKKQADDKLKQTKTINNMIWKNSTKLTSNGIKYFKNRNLVQALKHLDKTTINIQSNIYNGVESIVYTFKSDGAKTGIKKSLDKFDNGKGKFKRIVYNMGEVSFYIHRGNKKDNKFILVEGIEDGLSALVLGYNNFICLNSVSNASKFIEHLEKHIEKYRGCIFDMCFDCDNAGMECLEVFEDFFKTKDMNYNLSDYFLEIQDFSLKDLNDLVQYKTKE